MTISGLSAPSMALRFLGPRAGKDLTPGPLPTGGPGGFSYVDNRLDSGATVKVRT